MIFPTVPVALILPGVAEIPTDAATITAWEVNTTNRVKIWEREHSDIIFGGFVEGSTHKVGYMYNQILEFDPDDRAMELRRWAVREGKDYEDFLLHFTTDTVLELANQDHATGTSLAGVPFIVGYTASGEHAGFWLYQDPPWNQGAGVDAWAGAAGGGGLYVYLFERFDALALTLATGADAGELLVEYPSQCAATEFGTERFVTDWSPLTLISDGTQGLSQSGELKWKPPLDWKLCSTHDGSGKTYGGGAYFKSIIQNNGWAYVVRIMWKHGEQSSSNPMLTNVQLRRWIVDESMDSSTGLPKIQKIPGWDPANDLDGDGYVDDSEAAGRVNPAATARFRHESRAAPLGRMWSSASSWCRVNVWSTELITWLGGYYEANWKANGLLGAYNDDLLKLTGPAEYPVLLGGNVAEFPSAKINTTAMTTAYRAGFATLLQSIATVTGGLVSANVGHNLFMDEELRPYLIAMSNLLKEDYMTAGIGLTGYFGLQKAWDTGALAKQGVTSILQCMILRARVQHFGKTEENYQRDMESCVAVYLLLHVEAMTYLQVWGNGFNYGSLNTGSHNFYKEGVPLNMAYQPTELLRSADLGQPLTSTSQLRMFPASGANSSLVAPGSHGKEFMALMVKTKQPLSDYTIVGDSSDSILRHAEVSATGQLPTNPSLVFYAHRESFHNNPLARTPTSCLLARQFDKGLVLYRTDTFGGSASFAESLGPEVQLDGPYRRVNPDGSLSSHIFTNISLRGYEGAILLQVPQPSPAAVSSAAKASATLLALAGSLGGIAAVGALGAGIWLLSCKSRRARKRVIGLQAASKLTANTTA